MDARPNVLNKILPCSKRIPLTFRMCSGDTVILNIFRGYCLDDSSDEYFEIQGVIPLDFKTGSDFSFVVSFANVTANETGSAKVVRMTMIYCVMRNGIPVMANVVPEPVLITIPDNTPAETVQEVTLLAISDLLVSDTISIRFTRDADHTDDTLTGDLWLPHLTEGLYIADKIGVV